MLLLLLLCCCYMSVTYHLSLGDIRPMTNLALRCVEHAEAALIEKYSNRDGKYIPMNAHVFINTFSDWLIDVLVD
jgi:hypothetical protein